ncbi:hypothetical protein K439DRAFT_1277337, partial [Ramaria rubella]
VPQILYPASLTLICRFFHKMWCYMDAYRKGLNVQQATFAVKIYKLHRRVG